MIQPGKTQSWLKAFVLIIGLSSTTAGLTQTISGETVILEVDRLGVINLPIGDFGYMALSWGIFRNLNLPIAINSSFSIKL